MKLKVEYVYILMSLDIKKVYIDNRFWTSDSEGESNFSIELPRSFNVPDGVVAHIDDLVIPVSWTTVDEINNMCYIRITCGAQVRPKTFAFPTKNYDGYQFATALNEKLTLAAAGFDPLPVFSTTYDHLQHTLVISMTDDRDQEEKTITQLSCRF